MPHLGEERHVDGVWVVEIVLVGERELEPGIAEVKALEALEMASGAINN